MIALAVDADLLWPALAGPSGDELRAAASIRWRRDGLWVRRHAGRPLLVARRVGPRRLSVVSLPHPGPPIVALVASVFVTVWVAGVLRNLDREALFPPVLGLFTLAAIGMPVVAIASGVHVWRRHRQHSTEDTAWLGAVLDRAASRLPPPPPRDDYR